MNPIQELFTEKLRPKTLDQALIVPRIREELAKGLVDNVLFYGPAGSGKTVLSRILAYSHPYLEINASLERGIDIIRERVLTFAASSSLMDGSEQLKVILLEECDAMTTDAWNSLRALIEKYHANVRFVANCNYIEKIPEPIKSRFNCIPIAPANAEEETYLFQKYVERVSLILRSLKIKASQETIQKFVQKDFPDMRSIIKKIQQFVTRGITELNETIISTTFGGDSLFNIILNNSDPWKNYQDVIGEWGNKAEDGVIEIGKSFPEFLRNKKPELISKLPLIIIACAEAEDQLYRVTDKVIVLLALIFKIQMILNG